MFEISRSKLLGIIGVVMLVVGLASVTSLVENLDASEIMVIQYPMGELKVFTEPGPQYQGFGKVTKYPRQSQYQFCSTFEKDGTEFQCPGADSAAKRIRFSEGGHANLNGAVNWVMPLDTESVIKIHKKFNNTENLKSMAIGKMLDASIYLAGPLMTSTESSGSRRGELVQYIDDQAVHGVYVTKSQQRIEKDATGAAQTVTVTEITLDEKGKRLRQQGSVLAEFNISLLPISINELKYDKIVEQQIADRQKSTTDVQLSIATAVKAEQAAKTVEARGKETAAESKWKQETIKAQAVVEAQQKFEVASLAAKEAEQYKRQQILIGEGNSARMKLEMQANGALEPKLAAIVQMNKDQWNAIASYKGNWVPGVIMGNTGGKDNGANALVEMLTAKTAKQLSLDMKTE